MPNVHKLKLIEELQVRFGALHKLDTSQSLFVLGDDAARIYIRYSKVHAGGRTFFGLRASDLRQLEGHNSFICLLLDDNTPPMFVPFSEFEEVFRSAQPASDGQYKVQLFTESGAKELYIARQGRFNIEGFQGFDALDQGLDAQRLVEALDFTHSQIQSLIAGIGFLKGFDVFVPDNDAGQLDWAMTPHFTLRRDLPIGFGRVESILSEIDVVWIAKGRHALEGLFEVEHSTPIYSGLLRFNDVLLSDPKVSHFTIVSNDTRRILFTRQTGRPTFQISGLADLVSFLDYRNVSSWHTRLLRSYGET